MRDKVGNSFVDIAVPIRNDRICFLHAHLIQFIVYGNVFFARSPCDFQKMKLVLSVRMLYFRIHCVSIVDTEPQRL